MQQNSQDPQIIDAQYPIPVPWLAPPPPIPPSQAPSGPPIIGNPNAFWNDDIRNLPDRFRNWVETRPSVAVEEMCEEQYALDTINCNLKKAYAGSAAAQTCHEQAAKAYADCLRKGKKSDIPRYDFN
jgi:hypothetical protein